MAHWLDISRSQSPMVRAVHDYWSSKRVGERLPRREDIDPAEVKPLLPHLMIVDLVGEPMRVRYRLVGTKVAAATGFDFTGCYLDEFVANDADKLWHEYYRIARNERAAVLGNATVPTAGGGSFVYEFGIFPLSADGSIVGQCLSIEDYGKGNARLSELMEKIEPWGRRDGAR